MSSPLATGCLSYPLFTRLLPAEPELVIVSSFVHNIANSAVTGTDLRTLLKPEKQWVVALMQRRLCTVGTVIVHWMYNNSASTGRGTPAFPSARLARLERKLLDGSVGLIEGLGKL